MIEERVSINEHSTWGPPQCPFRIVYSIVVLERIRAAVTEAFYSLPRGGLEVGGVLFGARTKDSVSILTHRPLECEHARGPSFSLSENDRARLTALLAGAHQDPALKGMEALGWYHSHTRSEISLAEADVALHNRFFPKPWQVALVVRPHYAEPARAGFFFREPDGSMRTSETYLEFQLAPLPLPPEPEPEPEAEPEPGRPPDSAPFTASSEAPPEPTAFDYQTLPLPRSVREQPRRRFTVSLIIAVFIVGLAIARFWFGPQRLEQLFALKPQAISLSALDISGHLWVRWNTASAPVGSARSGVLQVTQGETKVLIDLDRTRLQQGGIAVPRDAERVGLRLILHQPDGKTAEERTSFIGPLPQRQPSKEEVEAQRQRDELAREAELMRAEMKAQSVRTRRLERTLQTLKDQLDEERAVRQPGTPPVDSPRQP